MLLYSLLHLAGVKAVNPAYETLGRSAVTLDDIKRFRQLGRKCPGHPEYRWTSGVETTTGPLGQGVAHERRHGHRRALAGQSLQPTRLRDVRLRRVRALVSDGDMMEGVSDEAASLAGAPQARQPVLDLRQQPHHDRGKHRFGLQRGRRHALRRLRLERDPRRRTPTTWRMLDRRLQDVPQTRRDRPTLDHRRQPHRLRRARQAGHQRRSRRARWARRRSARPSAATAGRRMRSSSFPTGCVSISPTASARAGDKLRERVDGQLRGLTTRSTPS